MIGSYRVMSGREDGEEGRIVGWKSDMDEQSEWTAGSR